MYWIIDYDVRSMIFQSVYKIINMGHRTHPQLGGLTYSHSRCSRANWMRICTFFLSIHRLGLRGSNRRRRRGSEFSLRDDKRSNLPASIITSLSVNILKKQGLASSPRRPPPLTKHPSKPLPPTSFRLLTLQNLILPHSSSCLAVFFWLVLGLMFVVLNHNHRPYHSIDTFRRCLVGKH